MITRISNILEILSKFSVVDTLFGLLKEAIEERRDKVTAAQYIDEILQEATSKEEREEYLNKIKSIMREQLAVAPRTFTRRKPTVIPQYLFTELETLLSKKDLRKAEKIINEILKLAPTEREVLRIINQIADTLPNGIYMNKPKKLEDPNGVNFLEERAEPKSPPHVQKRKDVTGIWIHVLSSGAVDPVFFEYKHSKTEGEKDKAVAELTRIIVSMKNSKPEMCVSDYKQGNWFKWNKNTIALEFYGTAAYAFSHDVWADNGPAGYRIPEGKESGAPRCEAHLSPSKCELTRLVVHPASDKDFAELVNKAAENLSVDVQEENPGIKVEYKFFNHQFSPEHWRALHNLLEDHSTLREEEKFIAFLNEDEVEQVNRLLNSWGESELEWRDPRIPWKDPNWVSPNKLHAG
jgi:hypothetical protein